MPRLNPCLRKCLLVSIMVKYLSKVLPVMYEEEGPTPREIA